MDMVRSSFAYRSSLFGALLVAALAFACGGGEDTPDPAAPAVPVATDGGRFLVAVETNPNPPIRGVNVATFTVTDANGAPVSDLPLEVLPWMPAHNHGTSVDPMITNLGN